MKLVFFIGSLDSGGAEHVVAELSSYLAKRHEVTILTWSKNKPHYQLDERVCWQPVEEGKRAGWLVRNHKRYRRLCQFVREARPDLYVAFLPIPTYLLLSLKGQMACPVLFAVRNEPYSEYGGGWKRMIARFLLRRADGVIYQTEEQKKYFDFLKTSHAAVIPNALSREYLWEGRNRTPAVREKRVISVGRLSRQKNFELLIRAFGEVSRCRPEYQLVIYGEGEDRRKLERLIRRLHLEETVFLKGITKEVKSELEKSELFVMTSDYEGIPNVLLEALSTGMPCIATDCLGGGARLLIENDRNGLLVPRGDKGKLVQAMNRVLSDTALRERLCGNAVAVRRTYWPEQIYAVWESYFCREAGEREGDYVRNMRL